MTSSFIVEPLRASEHHVWQSYLAGSSTGTLFHDLRFLGYHEPGRHDFHHLVFRDQGRVVALLPGALQPSANGPTFHSGAGASIGGPVFDRTCRLLTALAFGEALVAHARSEGWSTVKLTLAPTCYNGRLAGLPSFATSHVGFTLTNRNLCFVLPLLPKRPAGFADFFRETAATEVRAARRRGATVMQGVEAAFDLFLPLFAQTYARHGKAASHTDTELRSIIERCPDALQFYVACEGGVATGALCVFILNPRVASVFYICKSDEHPKSAGVLVAMADAIDHLSSVGLAWLDLGPSADHLGLNEGVVRFKEGLGADYHLREQWTLNL